MGVGIGKGEECRDRCERECEREECEREYERRDNSSSSRMVLDSRFTMPNAILPCHRET